MAGNSEFVSTSRIQSTKEHKASKERGERNKKNQLVTKWPNSETDEVPSAPGSRKPGCVFSKGGRPGWIPGTEGGAGGLASWVPWGEKGLEDSDF